MGKLITTEMALHGHDYNCLKPGDSTTKFNQTDYWIGSQSNYNIRGMLDAKPNQLLIGQYAYGYRVGPDQNYDSIQSAGTSYYYLSSISSYFAYYNQGYARHHGADSIYFDEGYSGCIELLYMPSSDNEPFRSYNTPICYRYFSRFIPVPKRYWEMGNTPQSSWRFSDSTICSVSSTGSFCVIFYTGTFENSSDGVTYKIKDYIIGNTHSQRFTPRTFGTSTSRYGGPGGPGQGSGSPYILEGVSPQFVKFISGLTGKTFKVSCTLTYYIYGDNPGNRGTFIKTLSWSSKTFESSTTSILYFDNNITINGTNYYLCWKFKAKK